MKHFSVLAAVAMLLLPLPVSNMAACGDTLPFTIKVTRVTPPALPEYFDPHTHPSPSGQCTDFPVSSVVIDGETWIIYKNGYSPKVIRYKGSRIDNAVRQPDGTLNPTHRTHGTVVNPYLLGGMWCDRTGKKLYGPMHCEYKGYTSGAGSASIGAGNGDGIKATVLHNAAVVWPETVVMHAKPRSHDLRVKVAKGDALSFRASRNGTVTPDDRAQWDPAITFVDPE